jgi:hypothetical protein
MTQQLTLWGEVPTIPGSELIGKQVMYSKGRPATIIGIDAYTEEWGTMYSLKVEGERFLHLAYADEFKCIGQQA